MTETTRPRSRDREVWLRRGCALIVAAYGSYEHQREFGPYTAAPMCWALTNGCSS